MIFRCETYIMKFYIATLLTITTIFLIPVSTTQICETICTCTDEPNGKTIDCSRTHLNVIPPVDTWPTDAKTLDLSYNNITTIDVEMAHENLATLKLHNNKISTIKASVFSGLKKLVYLDLSDNILQKLELNTFFGLDVLTDLNISYNNIQSLEDTIFATLYLMETLTLSSNRIRHVTKEHLNRMFELKRLDISNIGAYTLEPDIFHNFNKLEYLDLSDNEFHEVPTNGVRSASHLKHLKLNDNPITALDKTSFLGFGTVQRLELNFLAKLETIEANTFTPLQSLEVLEIKSGKNLHLIHPDAFKGLFENATIILKEIALDWNRLTTLSPLPCSSIKKMNLQRNPWNCDCRLKWIKLCKIDEIYAADLKCRGPSDLKNKLIVAVPENKFVCEAAHSAATDELHHNRVVRSVTLGIACAVVVSVSLLVILVLRWRNIRTWWRNKRKGTGAVYYVRAQANPIHE